MKPTLLGTGGSEGIPCIFCTCSVCERARSLGGHEIRSRSSLLLNDDTLVDFSPDLFYQSLQGKFNLNRLSALFLTHFHEDHVNVPEMESRLSALPALHSPVAVYCSPETAHQVQSLFKFYFNYGRPDGRDYFERYKLTPLPLWQPMHANGFCVTPIQSSHHGYGVAALGYNYIFEKNGQRLLYAVDTGWYPDVSWDFLDGLPLDGVIMECTYGDYNLQPYSPEHLNLSNMLDMLHHLQDLGCITPKTPVFLTHLCHLHSMTHEETQEFLNRCGYSVQLGYDFMELPFFT